MRREFLLIARGSSSGMATPAYRTSSAHVYHNGQPAYSFLAHFRGIARMGVAGLRRVPGLAWFVR